MYIYKLDFFPSVVILFVHLDGSCRLRQVIKTIAIAPLLPSVVVVVCAFFFYVLPQQDGHCCRLHFRMQCVRHALFIIRFDIALRSTRNLDTGDHRDQKDAERRGKVDNNELKCFAVSLFRKYFLSHSFFVAFRVCFCPKKKKMNSFIFVQYVFHLYLHDSSEMVSFGHLLALQQHF